MPRPAPPAGFSLVALVWIGTTPAPGDFTGNPRTAPARIQRAARYLESAKNGWQFQLFVRPRRGEAYCACGPLLLESAEGDRPMSLVWQFQAPLRGFAAHWSFLPFMPTGSASPTRCREVGLSRPMFASITDAASA